MTKYRCRSCTFNTTINIRFNQFGIKLKASNLNIFNAFDAEDNLREPIIDHHHHQFLLKIYNTVTCIGWSMRLTKKKQSWTAIVIIPLGNCQDRLFTCYCYTCHTKRTSVHSCLSHGTISEYNSIFDLHKSLQNVYAIFRMFGSKVQIHTWQHVKCLAGSLTDDTYAQCVAHSLKCNLHVVSILLHAGRLLNVMFVHENIGGKIMVRLMHHRCSLDHPTSGHNVHDQQLTLMLSNIKLMCNIVEQQPSSLLKSSQRLARVHDVYVRL